MKNEKSVNNVTIVILSLAKAKYRRIANNLEFIRTSICPVSTGHISVTKHKGRNHDKRI